MGDMIDDQLREALARHGGVSHPGRHKVIEDTSDFMRVQFDDVLELAGKYYLIRGDERETRFGLDGEPKCWVKRAIDLCDGSPKVIKLVFHESVYMSLSDVPHPEMVQAA